MVNLKEKPYNLTDSQINEVNRLIENMTEEEKVGQLVQCNAGNFIANSMEITGPDGEPLPAEEMNKVIQALRNKSDILDVYRATK